MTLKEYLDWKGLTPEEFAKTIGVDVVSVRRYRLGSRTPHRDVMVRIIEATDGHVSANDFLSRVENPRVKAESRVA